MAPTTTEKDIEIALQSALEELKFANLDLAELRASLDKAETLKISWKLEVAKLKEELRVFRTMYPNLCKPKE